MKISATPLKTFFILIVVIAVIESVLMRVLANLPFPPMVVGLLDAVLLVGLLCPFLYQLVYKPFQENIISLQQAKKNAEFGHSRLLTVLDSIDAIVYVADMDSHELLFVNKYTKEIFGDITGEICWQSLQAGQSGPCSFCTNDRLVGLDGQPFEMCQWEFRNTLNNHWYDIRDRAIRWIDGRLVRLEIATDITARKRSEEKIEQQNSFLQNVVESLPYPFYVVSTETYTVELANSIAKEQGLAPGSRCHIVTHKSKMPCGDETVQCPVNTVRKTGKPVIIEHVHTDRDGNDLYVEVHGYPIVDKSGDVVRMIEYQIDVSERKKAEERLRRMAVTDDMTGLYNRRGFLMLAEKQIKIADRQPGELFVLYADCDRLKLINDTLGHKAGDSLIKETAELLQNTFRQADIIGRLGGDEFVVLMVDESGKESEQSVKQRLDAAIAEKNNEPGRHYVLSISYGIARYDKKNNCSMEKFLSRADRIMYQQKREKKAETAAIAL